MDVIFINADSAKNSYQKLAENYSAIEPPTWALLLAESCRSKGFKVGILDCLAEGLSINAAVTRITDSKARIAVFVVYGQNPNSGTTSMSGALELAKSLKIAQVNTKICFVGSHTSALPLEVLSKKEVDIVILNEGVYAIHNLIKSNLKDDLHSIKGIGFKKKGSGNHLEPVLNEPENIVPQYMMDVDLPGYAWDLLPFKEKPLDLYRAHFWHAEFSHEKRTPFAAIYTSLGCQFACDFCMINIINRTNNEEKIDASHSRGMRFWSPEWVNTEMKKLANLGVKTLRISDEMFFLNRKFYEPILQNSINEEFNFNMWTYSRIDTVRKEVLPLFKKAGINWLALGIEAGNQKVRQEVSKGSFKEINIRDVCKNISVENINIISNYIFGFPDDNKETMNETLELALELNTEMANMYPCQALPGSPMFYKAKKNGWALPENYEGYGFLSYECMPLPTKYLTAAEVLKFRDDSWERYFKNPKYLELIKNKFGEQEKKNIVDMTSIKLKRKILGD